MLFGHSSCPTLTICMSTRTPRLRWPDSPNTLHHAKRLELFRYPRLVALPEARPEAEALKARSNKFVSAPLPLFIHDLTILTSPALFFGPKLPGV